MPQYTSGTQKPDVETLQAENDRLEQRIKELEAQLAGNIPAPEQEEPPKPDQPLSGTAETAKD